MPVVEYMKHRINGGRERKHPDFIVEDEEGHGHWFNFLDNTFVGWVDDDSDYFIPDSLRILSKEDFVLRNLAIHQADPMKDTSEYTVVDNPEAEGKNRIEYRNMTDQEVRNVSEQWYDEFVTRRSQQ